MTLKNFLLLPGVLVAGMAAFAGRCEAQVYSWVDPGTGQWRLSSVAPSWYSATRSGGPRTVVTLGPDVLDDTGQPEGERVKLQKRALALVRRSRDKRVGEDDPESGGQGTSTDAGTDGMPSKQSTPPVGIPPGDSPVERAAPL